MLSALATTLQDARYAMRGLKRNPVFSLTAILAAALGIGAVTAVFSAVDHILFRALPYADEDRLVSVGMMTPLDTNEFLFAEPYVELRRDPGPLQEITAFQAGTIATDLTESHPIRLRALRLPREWDSPHRDGGAEQPDQNCPMSRLLPHRAPPSLRVFLLTAHGVQTLAALTQR